MLSKTVCQHCHSKWSRWTDEDEIEWCNGFVMCPKMEGNRITAIIDREPPKNCPYGLEHVVTNECAVEQASV